MLGLWIKVNWKWSSKRWQDWTTPYKSMNQWMAMGKFHSYDYHIYCCGQESPRRNGVVQLFVTPWTAACQASLSITNSQSLPKRMSIKLVMASNHLTLCHPLLLLPSIIPSIRVFSSDSVFSTGGQSIGASASASVLPMNIQDWFHLGWTGWISLQSKGLSRVFSNTIVQKHQFFSAQLYL